MIAITSLLAGAVHSSQYYGPTTIPVILHSGYSHGYHGPTAVPHVLHDGYIADTYEVAATKAEHYAAVAKAQAYGGYGHEQEYTGQYAAGYRGYHGYSRHAAPYHGTLAKPVVLQNGYLADTHEVAAAKTEHLTAVAKTKSHGGYSHDHIDQYASSYGGYNGYSRHGQYSSGNGGYNGYSHHTAPYYGPLAKPVVLRNGYLADTHKVAAAKAEHSDAVARAMTRGGYGLDYSGEYYGGYHGPLVKPVVLPSGYLADTHEVALARQNHQDAHHAFKNGWYYNSY